MTTGTMTTKTMIATAGPKIRTALPGPNAKRVPFFLFAHFMDPHDPYMVHPFNGVGYARVGRHPEARLGHERSAALLY